jgi:hypothetical protein
MAKGVLMRAGTFAQFEKRFGPIEVRPGEIKREHHEIPEGTDYHLVWTLIEGDRTRRWYLSPGWHLVNRLGYVLCQRPFSDDDEHRDYVY